MFLVGGRATQRNNSKWLYNTVIWMYSSSWISLTKRCVKKEIKFQTLFTNHTVGNSVGIVIQRLLYVTKKN